MVISVTHLLRQLHADRVPFSPPFPGFFRPGSQSEHCCGRLLGLSLGHDAVSGLEPEFGPILYGVVRAQPDQEPEPPEEAQGVVGAAVDDFERFFGEDFGADFRVVNQSCRET